MNYPDLTENPEGQALVEWAIVVPLYLALFIAILVFGEWFVVRTQLITAVREGALLYSSGRMTAEQVKTRLHKTLMDSYPHLNIPIGDMTVGKSLDSEARNFELDEVRIDFHPNALMNRFGFQRIDEKCVIKHAPPYFRNTFMMPVRCGPPVPW